MHHESPTVALITDFGTRDPYAASVRLLLRSHTAAHILDLTHDIAPHDVWEAAFFLRFALDAWEGTAPLIVAAVVDPGVGSERRILAAQKGEVILLAPDNGLLEPVLDGDWDVRSVENRDLFRIEVSSTFHGRDRFAPVAAALAEEFPFERLGPPVSPVGTLGYAPAMREGDLVRGTAIVIDRFGNIITDVPSRWLQAEQPWIANLGEREVRDRAATYADRAGSADPFLIPGSRGTIEISVAGASAAALLQSRPRDPVRFRRTAARVDGV